MRKHRWRKFDFHTVADLRELLLTYTNSDLLDDLLVHDLFHFFVLLLLALPLAVFIIGPFPLQLRLQPRDLVLELAEHGVLRVLVDLGLVLDVLRAVRVAQRRHGLVVVVARGPAVRAHDGLRISPQRILEQSS